MNLIVIPARKGSQRLPGKNFRSFAGRPLIEYTINFALKYNSRDNVVISTDDLLIKEIGEKFDLYVIDRPEELSTNLASSASVVRHALLSSEERIGKNYDYVTTLQVTNPLRPKNLYDEAMKRLIASPEAKGVVSVSAIMEKLLEISDGHLRFLNYTPGQRSQDMKFYYAENGMIYVTSRELIIEGKIFDDSCIPLIKEDNLPETDIDTLSDFELGEFLFQKNIKSFEHLL